MVINDGNLATKKDLSLTEKRLNKSIDTTEKRLNKSIDTTENRLNKSIGSTENRLNKSIDNLRIEMKQDLNEAVDAILTGVDNITTSIVKEVKENRTRIEKLETTVGFMRHDIKDLKADLSLTPSREEFEKIKRQVVGS
jgi:DNA anti-recombination protein RmuC